MGICKKSILLMVAADASVQLKDLSLIGILYKRKIQFEEGDIKNTSFSLFQILSRN
jgi:hypothetical protein